PEALAAWLHGVAWRVARKLRAARRPASGPVEPPDPVADPARAAAWREVCAVLDGELHALPRRERDPLLLCYLDGLTRDEAAALGLAVALGFTAAPPPPAAPPPAPPAAAPPAPADQAGDPLPAGAVARIGSTRYRPGAGIDEAALSPDGRLVLTHSRRGVIL